ncbi:hypothetical protein Tco_0051569 [Tanacetum coccineum]
MIPLNGDVDLTKSFVDRIVLWSWGVAVQVVTVRGINVTIHKNHKTTITLQQGPSAPHRSHERDDISESGMRNFNYLLPHFLCRD